MSNTSLITKTQEGGASVPNLGGISLAELENENALPSQKRKGRFPMNSPA